MVDATELDNHNSQNKWTPATFSRTIGDTIGDVYTSMSAQYDVCQSNWVTENIE